MKKFLAATILFFTFMTSCVKNYYGNFSKPKVLVNGMNNIYIDEYRNTVVSTLEIIYYSGEEEKVRLSLEGIPRGIQTHISNNFEKPTFKSYIYFYDTSSQPAKPGKYEAKLVVYDSKQKIIEKYPFTITVKKGEDCRDILDGLGVFTSNCAIGNSSYAGWIIKSTNDKKRIFIDNFENTGLRVEATVDCNFNSISIPTQIILGDTIIGSGRFDYPDPQSITQAYITYYRTNAITGTTSCKLKFNK